MDGDWFWHAENCLNGERPIEGEYPLVGVPNGVAAGERDCAPRAPGTFG